MLPDLTLGYYVGKMMFGGGYDGHFEIILQLVVLVYMYSRPVSKDE